MNAATLEADWLHFPHGRLAYTLWRPAHAPPASIAVIAPPFAEELNKCRRMFGLLGQSMAARGMAVVVADLYGTGDSPGDFGEATWIRWRTDLCEVVAWARLQTGRPVGCVAVRAGALLALDALNGFDDAPPMILWSPAHTGRAHLTQFLRIEAAGAAAMGNATRVSTSRLWADLEAGRSIEVAGYVISPDVARPMAELQLAALLKSASANLVWSEVVAPGQQISAASRSVIESLGSKSSTLMVEAVEGEPFWATAETAVAPALIEHTCSVFARIASAA